MRKLLCVFLLLSVKYLLAFDLIKEFEIDFETPPQFFLCNDEIVIWADGVIKVYQGDKLVYTVKILNKGEGPGDFRVIQNIYHAKNKNYIWDRILRRITVFSVDWKLLETKKFTMPVFSALLGIFNEKPIFKWSVLANNEHATERNRKDSIGFIENYDRHALIEFDGVWVKGDSLNYDTPVLLNSFSENKIYYASNKEYKIYQLDLGNNKIKAELFITNKTKPLEWDGFVKNLQWEVIKKPVQPQNKIYPHFVPPLFHISSAGRLLLVVTNEKLNEKKAKLDLYKDGKYMGTRDIPILYQQHFVAPAIHNFPPDILISENCIYSVHYFPENDMAKLIKWKIILH